MRGAAGRFHTFGSRRDGGSIFINTPPPVEQVDPHLSTIGISNGTVASGSARTLTLTVRDGAGVQNATGGLTIVPSKSGGTATGTLGSVTDNGDGTYTWTYTGVLAGTAQTLGATINGVSVTSTLPTCAVTPGTIDRTVSTVTVSAATGAAGGATATLTLQAKDAAGNNLSAGGATVAFNHTGGTAGITIGSTTDVGNGTYTATVTPTSAGTATTFSATIGGLAVTTTMPTYSVTASNPSVFFVDWRTGTGGLDPAVTDGGKLIRYSNTGDMDVVSASGLGMPAGMSNCLRHTYPVGVTVNGNPSGRACFVALINKFSELQVGESLYIRYLYRNAMPDEGSYQLGADHHIFEGDNRNETGGIKSIFLMHTGNNTDGTFQLFFSSEQDGNLGNDNRKFYPNTQFATPLTTRFLKHHTYRIEIKLTIASTTKYGALVRIFNESGVLQHQEGVTGYTKMVNAPVPSTGTLVTVGNTLNHSNINWFNDWEFGNNGGVGNSWSVPGYDYWAGVRFSKTDWNGEYNVDTE